MDRPPPPASEYWYAGSQDRAVDDLFRRACSLAWPYALFCATRYLHDIHAAYDLMDAAVSNAEQYYERFNGNRTASQIFYRIISVLKRLSKQRVQNNREIPSGSLPDLEEKARTLSSKPEAEQRAVRGTNPCPDDRAYEEDHLLAAGGSHLATDCCQIEREPYRGAAGLPQGTS